MQPSLRVHAIWPVKPASYRDAQHLLQYLHTLHGHQRLRQVGSLCRPYAVAVLHTFVSMIKAYHVSMSIWLQGSR